MAQHAVHQKRMPTFSESTFRNSTDANRHMIPPSSTIYRSTQSLMNVINYQQITKSVKLYKCLLDSNETFPLIRQFVTCLKSPHQNGTQVC